MAKDESTPKAAAAEPEKAEPTTTVTLRRARVYQNRAYGPGRDVPVPTRVAEAFTAQDAVSGAAARHGSVGTAAKRRRSA